MVLVARVDKTFCKKYKEYVVSREELYKGTNTIYVFREFRAIVAKHKYTSGLEMLVQNKKEEYVRLHTYIRNAKELEILLEAVERGNNEQNG